MQGKRLFAALAACVGIAAGADAAGGRGGSPPPCHVLTVAQDEQAHKLTCVVARALPPTKRSAAIVYLTLPADFVLESATASTVSGRAEAEVSALAPWSGPYWLAIDEAKVNCAASGSLVLVVRGDFAKETVTCPVLPLFEPAACSKH